MKRISFFFDAAIFILAAVLFSGCSQKGAEAVPVHPEWAYNSVIYEMNVRQYTPERTFAAASE